MLLKKKTIETRIEFVMLIMGIVLLLIETVMVLVGFYW